MCVADPLTQCPDERGREILGTDESDNIVGTLGPTRSGPRGGNDSIKARAGDDLIVSRGGGCDKVKCGGGKDLVEADKQDRIGEELREGQGRAKKARKKGKKK